MNPIVRLFGALGLAMALTGWAAPVAAQQSRLITNSTFLPAVGSWQIQSIEEAGKFDRCRAVLEEAGGLLMLVQWTSRKWGLAVPNRQLKPGTKVPMEIELGRASFKENAKVDSVGDFIFITMPEGLVGALRGGGRMTVQAADVQGQWQLRQSSEAMRAVESCVSKGLAAKPVGTAPPGPLPAGKRIYLGEEGGLCVGTQGGAVAAYMDMVLVNCDAAPTFALDTKAGKVRFAKRPNMCVEVNLMPDGVSGLQVRPCAEDPGRWRLDGAAQQLRNQDHLCWEVPGGKFNPGQVVSAAKCSKAPRQKFVLNE